MKLSRDNLIEIMVNNLPTLRACSNLTQAELGKKIGLSRCTIINIESKKRKMKWPIFLSLLLLFSQNERANKCLSVFGLSGQEIDDFILTSME